MKCPFKPGQLVTALVDGPARYSAGSTLPGRISKDRVDANRLCVRLEHREVGLVIATHTNSDVDVVDGWCARFEAFVLSPGGCGWHIVEHLRAL